ncbi:MAG: phosphatase PAP2 family protein [Fibrobacter sp.]|nr:phosphatase PAP2 family protein [Fibrobacter sp.]
MVRCPVIFRTLALCAAVCLCLGSHKAFARDEYPLSLPLDITLSVVGLATTGLGTYLYDQMEVKDPADLRAREDFLPWDRWALGRYSKTAQTMSDIGAAVAVAPLVIGGVSWYKGYTNGAEFGTFTLMFVQAILFQNGINLATRSLQIWPRPYIYSTSKEGLEAAQNAKGEAYGSLFSGHASAAFTVAVFASEWYDYAFPNATNTWLVRTIAFSLAGIESALRVAAGKHYPTDILVGALVGTGISYGILTLHKKRNEKFSMWVGPGVAGVTLRY